MHPAQRHAVMAIISGVEQMLYNLKQILAMPADFTGPSEQRPFVPAVQPHLSAEEEDTLEEKMERDRLALMKIHEETAQRSWAAIKDKE